LILTIKNEEKTIRPLLESILQQTKQADEVVIVDGGSSDSTVNIIKTYENKLPINLIVLPNVNIARGRNIAIKNAKNDIIASTDGGCVLDKNWLEKITSPFEINQETDVVSGAYLPLCEDKFQELASQIIFPDVSKLDESFLPSARSIAFKKALWEKVGGFPEDLKTAEDTIFDIKLKRFGARFVLSKEAIVFWRVRENLSLIFKQFYNYAKGEGSARFYPFNYLIRYGFFSGLVLLIIFMSSNPFVWAFAVFSVMLVLWLKRLRNVKSLRELPFCFLIAISIELGISIGYISGLFD
jgi:glycosyltransferase involved in cell wall biosynthesis